MISYMIITAIGLGLLGLVTLVTALRHTADGYEDEFGFHEGTDPQREFVLVFGPASAPVEAAAQGRQTLIRAKSVSRYTPRKVARPDPVVPLSAH